MAVLAIAGCGGSGGGSGAGGSSGGPTPTGACAGTTSRTFTSAKSLSQFFVLDDRVFVVQDDGFDSYPSAGGAATQVAVKEALGQGSATAGGGRIVWTVPNIRVLVIDPATGDVTHPLQLDDPRESFASVSGEIIVLHGSPA